MYRWDGVDFTVFKDAQIERGVRMFKSGKPWRHKIRHIRNEVNNWYGVKLPDSEAVVGKFGDFLEMLHTGRQAVREAKVKRGEIVTNFTPTDKEGTFEKVDPSDLVIGRIYRLGWAWCGAVFKLVALDPIAGRALVCAPTRKYRKLWTDIGDFRLRRKKETE